MTQKQPDGTNTITPYLTVKGADKAVEFYKYVLNAKDDYRLDGPDGKIMHVSLKIGDSKIMMTERRPEFDKQGMGETRNYTYVYVDDPDATIAKAKEKGGKVIMEPMDMFYGDRNGCFVDPFGQTWSVAKHIEDVSEDEMTRRAQDMFKKKAA